MKSILFGLSICFLGQNLFADIITCSDSNAQSPSYTAKFTREDQNTVTLTIPQDDTSLQEVTTPCFPGQTGLTFTPPVLACTATKGGKRYFINLWGGGPAHKVTIEPATASQLLPVISLPCDK